MYYSPESGPILAKPKSVIFKCPADVNKMLKKKRIKLFKNYIFFKHNFSLYTLEQSMEINCLLILCIILTAWKLSMCYKYGQVYLKQLCPLFLVSESGLILLKEEHVCVFKE